MPEQSNIYIIIPRDKTLMPHCTKQCSTIQKVMYAIKSLRNAIAHNNVIFDTRFKTGKIDKRLISLLQHEVGISNLDFKYMDAYVVMITYFLRKMGETKTACKQFITSYQQLTSYLRNEIPVNIYDQIVGTQHKSNMMLLQNFISRS